MRLSRRERLPIPVAELFVRARDELHVLADWLPDVRTIEPLTQSSSAGCVERVDRWRTRELGVSRAALPTTSLEWITTSRWDELHHRVTWRLDVTTPVRGGMCRGELRLRPLGPSACEVSWSLEVTVDRGLLTKPFGLLSRAWRPLAERVIRQLLERNLEALRQTYLVAPVSRAS